MHTCKLYDYLRLIYKVSSYTTSSEWKPKKIICLVFISGLTRRGLLGDIKNFPEISIWDMHAINSFLPS